MRKNKPLDESHKTGQTSGTKMASYSKFQTGKKHKFKQSSIINTKKHTCARSFPVTTAIEAERY
ncbi:hypothetical protein Hanom_Chr01g00086401 [Helianthus anomalus]